MTIHDSPELRRQIARAVLDDLEDRRGIKWELQAVAREYPETYAEIGLTIAAKVMAVLRAHDADVP